MLVRVRQHFTLATREDILFALSLLVRWNQRVITTRRLPPLYSSGVRYQRELEDYVTTRPVEDWLGTDELYRRGKGDCEDLAATLAAELRLKGYPAKCVLRRRGKIFHVMVQQSPGVIHDPSRRLGM